MSKHTKGPWEVDYTKQTVRAGLGVNVAFCGESVVAGRAGVQSVGAMEARANARLIAVSPELADALRDLLEAVQSMQGTFGVIRGKTPEDSDMHTHDEWAESFLAERAEAAAAVLAKATGEQHE